MAKIDTFLIEVRCGELSKGENSIQMKCTENGKEIFLEDFIKMQEDFNFDKVNEENATAIIAKQLVGIAYKTIIDDMKGIEHLTNKIS